MSYSFSVILCFCVYSLPQEHDHRTVAYQWTSASVRCCGNMSWASRWLVMDFRSGCTIAAFSRCLPNRCLAMVIFVTICFALPTQETWPEFRAGYIRPQMQLHVVWTAMSELPLALHSFSPPFGLCCQVGDTISGLHCGGNAAFRAVLPSILLHMRTRRRATISNRTSQYSFLE
jgi:hypothetical protein